MKHLILGLAGALVAGLAWGQDVPYATELISQPYAPLEEYSTLDLELGWDDPEVMLPIPFDMVIWGDTCSFLGTANLGNMLFAVGTSSHLIAPVFADICDVAPADSTGQDVSEIRHTVEGVAPNRVFKLEYHNVGFYPEVYNFEDTVPQATQRATYQVWLHESGTITFHYGPNTVTDPLLVADGFINSAGLIGNFDPYSYGGTLLVAEGEADAPEFQTFNDLFSWFYGNGTGWGTTWPSEGTGYVFNPAYPLSVEAPELLSSVSAFPNPASSLVNVTLDGPRTQGGTWLDAQGRIAGTIVLQPGTNQLDVSGMTPGAYALRLDGGEVIRVTIQR